MNGLEASTFCSEAYNPRGRLWRVCLKTLKIGAGGMRPVRDAVIIARHEVPGLERREKRVP